jgi:hypothetical protein
LDYCSKKPIHFITGKIWIEINKKRRPGAEWKSGLQAA